VDFFDFDERIEMNRLKGKVAIVTGSGSGIGRGIAQKFANEGARVVVADASEDGGRETVRLIEEAGGVALFQRTDVTSAADIQALVASTLQAFGTITTLVNNAGISAGDTLRLDEVTEEAWDRIMNINLKGVFLCCKYVLPVMVAAKGGAIVNIASAAAIGMAPRAAYAASKGGVAALTRSLAFQYGHLNIRANAICPGPIETPMSAASRASGLYKERIVDSLVERMGKPEDIAFAAVYLASDESRYVTSDMLLVDGGALRLKKELFLDA
jgi:NAD(P)-dependent dehydrogenase (short-subunit alcohol dehydrogenase family)